MAILVGWALLTQGALSLGCEESNITVYQMEMLVLETWLTVKQRIGCFIKLQLCLKVTPKICLQIPSS